ncbi:MAG: transporter substrate-binding domain-containing protein [Nitratireductor sp.]
MARRKRIQAAFGLIATAMLLTLALPAAAEKPVIKLVTGGAYHPYTDESLPGGGLAVVLVKRIFDEMGFRAEVDFLPWDEGYAAAREGRYIATFPYIVQADRKQHFAYTTELFQVRPSLFWSVRRRHRIVQLSDVAGKSLCVPDGWAIDGYLEPIVESGDLTPVAAPTIRACFEKLKDGSADLVSVDRRLGVAVAEAIDPGRWVKSRRFVTEGVPNHVIFTLKHPQARAWAHAFDKALADLQARGELYAIIKAYYGD